MEWDIDFISEETFRNYLKDVIKKYGSNMISYDINALNRNIIDPIKMIFDKNMNNSSWEQIIKSEIFRQRNKSNDGDIGYFHQNIFRYMPNCFVPDSGWDIIFSPPSGYELPNNDIVKTIYVELKNKHNTMNSSSAQKTYIQMQHTLLDDDSSACFLVETIAKQSQNIPWKCSIDGKSVHHNRIRRVSIDKFYEIVTGDSNAFFKICKVLPGLIESIMLDKSSLPIPKDTAYQNICDIQNCKNISFVMALYLLAFKDYNGFRDLP